MYIDTGLFAKLFLPEPESSQVQAAVSSTCELACSELLIVEFSSVLARKVREESLTAQQSARVLDLFEEQVATHRIHLLPLDREVLTDSADLLRDCQLVAPLRSLDAIHLATCRRYHITPLFTTDRVMLRAADHLGIPVCSL